MAKKENSREAILDAAEEVILKSGAAHMSLDVVAKKAKVSKGGLMYHFPSKNTLIKAMISRLIEEFYSDREKNLKVLRNDPSDLLKAGILTTFERNRKRDRMGLSILAAASYDPDLLEPLRQAHKDHLKELTSSKLKFERAAILSLAADGMLLQELLGISPFNIDDKHKIRDEMMRMIDEIKS